MMRNVVDRQHLNDPYLLMFTSLCPLLPMNNSLLMDRIQRWLDFSCEIATNWHWLPFWRVSLARPLAQWRKWPCWQLSREVAESWGQLPIKSQRKPQALVNHPQGTESCQQPQAWVWKWIVSPAEPEETEAWS